MSRILKPKMNMPVAPKQKIAMTPIGTIAKESEEAQAKRRGGKGIAAGSGEKMRKVGSPGSPSAKNFAQSAKTAKKPKKTLLG